MKKLFIISLCGLSSVSAMAQTSLVNRAEEAAMSNDVAYEDAFKILVPAMTNPETAGDARTFMVAGKIKIAEYDEYLQHQKDFGLPEERVIDMCDALLDGYGYLMKVIEIENMPDTKGVRHKKYTDDAVAMIAARHPYMNEIFKTYWDNKAYGKAYAAISGFIDVAENPLFGNAIRKEQLTDAVMGEIMYNQALAAWQNEDLKSALEAFLNAREHGFKTMDMYRYALKIAVYLGDMKRVSELGREADGLFGDKTGEFMTLAILDNINAGKYDEALATIDDAIGKDRPANVKSQYYVLRGAVLEQKGDAGEAKDAYTKAMGLDPNNAQAYLNYGVLLYNEAAAADAAAPSDDDGYAKVFYEQIKPMVLKSIESIEKAVELQPDLEEALRILEKAYYLVNDTEGMKSAKQRLKNLGVE